MSNGVQNKNMNKSEMLFIFTSLISLTAAIRVDWNTNKGPIVPPTTTIRPVPKPPFRDPAPVWENQYDDLVNPNPYIYVLPPPSRPKLPDDNYARAPNSPQDIYRGYQHQQQPPNYSEAVFTKLSSLATNDINGNYYNHLNLVPSLSVYYIPNVGLKYEATVPKQPSSSSSTAKSYYLKENDIYDKYNAKLNGKYNPKLKKYKAYEKMKYTPHSYYYTPVKQQNFVNQPLPYLRNNEKITTTNQPFYSSSSSSSTLPLQESSSPASLNQNTKDVNRLQKDTKGNTNVLNALPTNYKPEK